MFSLIPALIRAWQAGQIIRNPAKWKSGAELALAVAAFVSSVFVIILFFFPGIKEYLTVEMASYVGAAIIDIIGMIGIVVGRVSTKKEVGLNVLIAEIPEQPNPGRREEDFLVPKHEKRIEYPEDEERVERSKNVVPSNKLGPGFRKNPPPGHDVI